MRVLLLLVAALVPALAPAQPVQFVDCKATVNVAGKGNLSTSVQDDRSRDVLIKATSRVKGNNPSATSKLEVFFDGETRACAQGQNSGEHMHDIAIECSRSLEQGKVYRVRIVATNHLADEVGNSLNVRCKA